MDMANYQKWIDYLIHDSRWKFSADTFNSGYQDLTCRSNVAGFLYIDEKHEPAAEILESILDDIKVSENEKVDEELLINTYWKLSIIYRDFYRNAQRVLWYVGQALTIAEQSSSQLHGIGRGYIWRIRLETLRDQGEIEQALVEINTKIPEFREKYGSLQTNSYLYTAYSFLAENEKEMGNWEMAVQYLYQALQYFPLEEDESMFQEILSHKNEDLQKAYMMMDRLTQQTVWWDI